MYIADLLNRNTGLIPAKYVGNLSMLSASPQSAKRGARIWALNSSTEYNALVRIPNPGVQPKWDCCLLGEGEADKIERVGQAEPGGRLGSSDEVAEPPRKIKFYFTRTSESDNPSSPSRSPR